MIRPFIAAAAAMLLAPAAMSHEGSPVPETVNWSIEPSGELAKVQFTISYRTANSRSTWNNTTPLAELRGLDTDQLEGDGTPVRFQVVRDAGRFDCDGVARRGRGTGECRFEPDTGFAAALAQRGLGAPTRSEQYQLALARVGLGLVDELDRLDYVRPSIGDLVSAGIHGVTADFIRAMSRSGHHVGTLDGLVRMRIHGVTPELVEAFAAAGYRPNPDTLVALRIHGATPDYIRALGQAGGGRFREQDLIAMRIHGVTPDFVRELAALGYTRLTAAQLTSMRIHGVTPDFARRAIERRSGRPSAEELVSLRIHGER